jgi:hypothetical protein
LDGGAQVLHKFLEVFSAFDWDTFALSLQGPIRLASFPNAKRARGAPMHGNTLMHVPQPIL